MPAVARSSRLSRPVGDQKRRRAPSLPGVRHDEGRSRGGHGHGREQRKLYGPCHGTRLPHDERACPGDGRPVPPGCGPCTWASTRISTPRASGRCASASSASRTAGTVNVTGARRTRGQGRGRRTVNSRSGRRRSRRPGPMPDVRPRREHPGEPEGHADGARAAKPCVPNGGVGGQRRRRSERGGGDPHQVDGDRTPRPGPARSPGGPARCGCGGGSAAGCPGGAAASRERRRRSAPVR